MPANPQTENGFVMVALDLFVATLASGIPGRDLIVLAEVLIQSYGPHKRRDVFLDPIQIEAWSGLPRTNARDSIRGLVAAGILRANDDGSHRFVKDYESWTVCGEAFEDIRRGGILRFALSAVGRFGRAVRRIVKSKDASPKNECGALENESPDNRRCTRKRVGDICRTHSNSSVCTIDEAPASEDLRVEREEEPPLAPPRGGRSRGASGKGDRGRSPESRSERRAREIEDELRALGERWAREGTDGR